MIRSISLLVLTACSMALLQAEPVELNSYQTVGTKTAPAASPSVSGGIDLGKDARILSKVVSCAPHADPVPARLDPKIIEAHCTAINASIDKFRKEWLEIAMPFLANIVPADHLKTVVYPFGGGDLLTALATFPKAETIITLSLEGSGDVRCLGALSNAEKLTSALADARAAIDHLLIYTHSKTIDMEADTRSLIPGELALDLTGLTMLGYEPVSLRYFHIEPDGKLKYLEPAEIAALQNAPAGKSETNEERKARLKSLHALFSNVEITFRTLHAPDSSPVRTFRHIAANLDDEHLKADASTLRYLESLGKVTAMTKAASYLLWWGNFTTIRNYLLKHMQWMISDSTGIPPRFAKGHGFVQDTWGVFEGPFLKAGEALATEFRNLWKNNPQQDLPFSYGYPDNNHHKHLLVTRRPAPRAAQQTGAPH